MENKKQIEILWTGGFDSTFRICQLSRLDVEVTPYYLFNNRPTAPKEIETMNSIRSKLLNNPRTIAKINPVVVVPVEARKVNKEITDAFERLEATRRIGLQYGFLGVFAFEHEGIEIGLQDGGHAKTFLQKHGTLKEVDEGYGVYYVLDKETTDPDCFAVFGHYHFPILGISKRQMAEKFAEMDLGDIMDETWFCYTPIDGKPCGKCPPCCFAIEQGMISRFSPAAIRNYIISKNEAKLKRENKKASAGTD